MKFTHQLLQIIWCIWYFVSFFCGSLYIKITTYSKVNTNEVFFGRVWSCGYPWKKNRVYIYWNLDEIINTSNLLSRLLRNEHLTMIYFFFFFFNYYFFVVRCSILNGRTVPTINFCLKSSLIHCYVWKYYTTSISQTWYMDYYLQYVNSLTIILLFLTLIQWQREKYLVVIYNRTLLLRSWSIY